MHSDFLNKQTVLHNYLDLTYNQSNLAKVFGEGS